VKAATVNAPPRPFQPRRFVLDLLLAVMDHHEDVIVVRRFDGDRAAVLVGRFWLADPDVGELQFAVLELVVLALEAAQDLLRLGRNVLAADQPGVVLVLDHHPGDVHAIHLVEPFAQDLLGGILGLVFCGGLVLRGRLRQRRHEQTTCEQRAEHGSLPTKGEWASCSFGGADREHQARTRSQYRLQPVGRPERGVTNILTRRRRTAA